MSDTPSPAVPVPKKSGCLKWFFLGAMLILCALGGGLWFMTTDSGVRLIVLPLLSKNLGVEIHASKAVWKPLSDLTLENLRVGPAEAPMAEVARLQMTYQGAALWKNRHLDISLLSLEKPKIFTRPVNPHALPAPPSKPGKNVNLTWSVGSLKISGLEWNGTRDDHRWKVQNVSLAAAPVTPGREMTLQTDGEFSWSESDPKTEAGGRFELKGTLQWTEDLVPTGLIARLAVDRCKGRIVNESLDGIAVRAAVNLTAAGTGGGQLRDTHVTLERDGIMLTSLTVSGTMTPTLGEAELDFQLGPVRSNILNLLGAARQIDFLDSSLSVTGHLSATSGGQLIRTTGRLEARPLNISSPRLPANLWKPVQLTTEQTVSIDRSKQQVTISKLSLEASQQNAPLLKASLNQPMSLSWAEGHASAGTPPAFVAFQLFPTDLAPWLALMHLPESEQVRSGKVSANASFSASEGGKTLTFDGHFFAEKISFQNTLPTKPSLPLTDGSASFDGVIVVTSLDKVHISPSAIRIAEKGMVLLSGTLDGNMDLSDWAGAGNLDLDLPLPPLFTLKPVPNLTVASGNLKTQIDWKLVSGGHWILQTDLITSSLDVSWKNIRYPKATLTFRGGIDWNTPRLKLQNAQLDLNLNGAPAGSWKGNFSGLTDFSSFESEFTVSNLRQSALAPVIAASFPDGSLRSIDLSGKASMRYGQNGFDIKASADLKQFAFDNRELSGLPPLNFSAAVDMSTLSNATCVIRSASAQWDPTAGAKNQIFVSGEITPALAHLKVQSPSLDFTPWYDRFFPAYRATPGTPAPGPGQNGPVAPPPSAAPTRDLNLTVSVDTLILRSLKLTGLQLTCLKKGPLMKIEKAGAKMGGVPFSLNFQQDMATPSKPVYGMSFNTVSMPITPWLLAFNPGLKDSVSGNINVAFTLGASGTGWQQIGPSLNGSLDFSMRNADIEKIPSIRDGLAQLGKVLDSPQIAAAEIDSIDFSAQVSGGRMTTKDSSIGGDVVQSFFTGSVLWNGALSMDTTFKAKRAALKQSAFFTTLPSLGGQESEWSKLPGAAKLSGTISQPVFTFDKNKMLGEAAVNAGANLLMDLLKGAGKDQKQGQQNPSEPTQQQDDQNALGGLLKGLFK
ncbi:MAG: AsmA-like C-terminal region-containing protein [Verrucomicrobiae bacterium]|nr:AsmA-like C-terminal region-containing protein [Verrucomicrobiae bacterium]